MCKILAAQLQYFLNSWGITRLDLDRISEPTYPNYTILYYMNRITFLLGAGASIPAGFASTECLTEKILAPEGYHRHTDGRFYRGSGATGIDYITPVVRRIIRLLFEQTHGYFQYREELMKLQLNLDHVQSRKSNYEDIYFLASQLRDDANELQNPAILPLICKLKCEMILWSEFKEYCDVYSQDIRDPDRLIFNEFCSETCHYIEDIVVSELSQNGKCCTKHLEIIKTIYQADGLELQGIATLAHDTHVERSLSGADIKLLDGFGPPIRGDSSRIWKNQFSSSDGVPFVKLHGSVNWNLFDLLEPSNNGKLPKSEIGVLEPSHLNNSVYRYDADINDRPLLLVGTFNKPTRYNWGLMLDIHYRFREILRNSDTLVVCGYSFGDKAINTQLIFWQSAERSRSLVVIDPLCRRKIIGSARYAAAQLLKDERTTRFITERMEDVEPHVLLRELDSR